MTGSPAPARVTSVGRLVDEAVGFVRMIHVLKTHDATRSSRSLLFALVGHGPMRLTGLADAVHADPSTVSRQVAELVRDDLVRREADPDDGRASLLVVTDAGQEAVAGLRAARTLSLSEALADWTQEEITDFTAGLQRFRAAMAASLGRPAGPADPTPARAATAHLPSDQEPR